MIDVNLKIIKNSYENNDAIDNAIAYIYRLNKRTALPLYCYGVEYPPTYRNVIKSFHKTRDRHPSPPDQQLYHLVLSIEFLLPNINFFHLADDVAKLFDAFPVCFSFHTDTDHPHFHFIISTVSYISGHPCLNDSALLIYLQKSQLMAQEKHAMLLNIR